MVSIPWGFGTAIHFHPTCLIYIRRRRLIFVIPYASDLLRYLCVIVSVYIAFDIERSGRQGDRDRYGVMTLGDVDMAYEAEEQRVIA